MPRFLPARSTVADTLSRTTIPTLVTHGRNDTIVLPSMAQLMLDNCPTAVPSWHDGVGHMPFWESPEQFDRELADLVRRVNQ